MQQSKVCSVREISYISVFAVALCVLFGGTVAPAISASALQKDRSSLPITIKSNELAADNKGKTAIFTGKVVAKQGDITIYADRVSINYGTTKGEVEQIEAQGNVRIVQQNRTGIASHAIYHSKEGRIALTGNPQVVQGSDTISGETITYFIDEDRSIVTGGANKRVEAVIQSPSRKANGSR
ncbi:lipopolysaccharide transport periplasmic protein LptA [Pelotalea chapellei]|uniref:Lipopolysaccharide transport periplasmic protein LptA n=1 Tax=Pelotalea chapellei TaxID=44671 RepID=A0ABS5U5T8_9BACT|nr:lipopolysaccharide transport periplasmic protein LptA [Pelotalea chapellei]MBT1071024.1 lipopolysaccharide transport periplasmic protein LptA [Pelotalea chapellei]